MSTPLSAFSWSNAPRQGLGSFFRHLVDFIVERGLANEVLARVSPETRSIWEKPPRPLSWLAAKHIHEVEAAFLEVAGEQVTKGIHLEWTEPQSKGGAVVASFDGPGTPRAAFLVLQGSLQFAFELCGVSGEVGSPEVLADVPEGARVRYRVRWS